MNQGVLLNATVGTCQHPQSPGQVAGGMTYRPPVAAVAVPAPAGGICPMPTKKGDECRGYPTLTGFCTGHSNQIGHSLKELLGG